MLIVEDGTGVENANSLISLEYADDFLAMFGDCWCGCQDEKEKFIKLANYMMCGLQFTGTAIYENLPFPRKCAYDKCADPCCDKTELATDEIPEKVKQAIALLAMGLLSGGVTPFGNNAQGVVSSFSVGGISVDFEKGKGVHMDDIHGGDCEKKSAKCDSMPQVMGLLSCFMKTKSVGKVRSVNVVQRFSRPYC